MEIHPNQLVSLQSIDFQLYFVGTLAKNLINKVMEKFTTFLKI